MAISLLRTALSIDRGRRRGCLSVLHVEVNEAAIAAAKRCRNGVVVVVVVVVLSEDIWYRYSQCTTTRDAIDLLFEFRSPRTRD